MNRKLKLIIGILWALPITSLMLTFYIIPMWLLKQYSYVGWDGLAWRWNYVVKSQPKTWFDRFVDKQWLRWNGFAMGNIVVLKIHDNPNESNTIIHEHEHVIQCMRLGIFQPILYGLFWILAKYVLRNVDPYQDSLFEIDARNAVSKRSN